MPDADPPDDDDAPDPPSEGDPPANAGQEQGARDGAGRWAPGTSGNPGGRPSGSRSRTAIALDAVAAGEADAVVRALVTRAKAGDVPAAVAILARLWPPARSRPVRLALPPIAGAADLPAASAVVVAAMADGSLAPDEAAAIVGVLSAHAGVLETADLEARIARLEAEMATPDAEART